MDLSQIQDIINLALPFKWPGAIVVVSFLFKSPIYNILAGIGKRINGRMEETDRGILEGLSNDLTHDVKEMKRDIHELKQEQVNQGKDISWLKAKVNGQK